MFDGKKEESKAITSKKREGFHYREKVVVDKLNLVRVIRKMNPTLTPKKKGGFEGGSQVARNKPKMAKAKDEGNSQSYPTEPRSLH